MEKLQHIILISWKTKGSLIQIKMVGDDTTPFSGKFTWKFLHHRTVSFLFIPPSGQENDQFPDGDTDQSIYWLGQVNKSSAE